MSLAEIVVNRPSLSALAAHVASLSAEDAALIEKLIRLDQGHLFEGWGEADEETRATFLAELRVMDESYPGGLTGYVKNARVLLAESREGKNPFEGCTPAQPATVDLTSFDDSYLQCEQLALSNLDKIGVVLVAGGLGERLGYPGIKLDIAVEVVQNMSYLAHYAAVLKAMEARGGRPVPFVIMVSRDTYAGTLAALESNEYFGLSKDQVHLLKQELVPALMDNDGHLALAGPCQIAAKPHGHGDIHMLLHTSGVARRLQAAGINHLVFIQDTNGQVFNAAFAAVGASIREGYDFNSVGVNRIPGEAVGALCKLEKGDGDLTLNVEYNQLDPLLRATISPEGDVANEKGFSIFPGNINVLVVALKSYCEILEQTKGIIAEFVNPKYADASRTAFKKPTRLETMMQDLPKLFGAGQKVGVTIFDRVWCFSADKNKVEEAAAKAAAGGPPESAATAESDFFWAGRQKLVYAGMKVEEAPEMMILGIPHTPGPRALLRPSFALGLQEVKEKISGGAISGDATLVVEGAGVSLKDVEITAGSALVIKACDGARVRVEGLKVDNQGYSQVLLSEAELASEATPAYLKIRGYRMEAQAPAIYLFDQPGVYTIGSDGRVQGEQS
jgi:UDP-sugar pyrophosphorylase